MSDEKSPVLPGLPRHRKVSWSRLKWRWPFLVWILFALLGWYLFHHGGRLERTYGIVEYAVDPVWPMSESYVTQLRVVPGQKVQAGDVIAELDSTAVDAQIAELQLELEEQAWESHLALLRDASDNVLSLEREIRTIRLNQARDIGALDSLRNQIADLEKAVQSGALTRDVLSRLEKDVGGLEKAVALYPALLDETQQALDSAQRKAGTLANGQPQVRQTEAAKKLAATLEAGKALTTLRAPRAGTVINIYAQTGQMVHPRMLQPIAEIVADKKPVIHAFIQEDADIMAAVGEKVTIFSSTSPKDRTLTGTIAYLAPVIEVLRDRLNPVPNHFVHGRKVIIEIDSTDHALLPGQAVQIRYGEPGWWDLLTH